MGVDRFIPSPAGELTRVALLVACLLLAGCGSYFAPAPTSRQVAMNDLAGTWSYRPLVGDAEVALVLKSDGTFEQTVVLPAQTLTQSGTWGINGPVIALDEVLVEFNGWRAQHVAWSIIDRDESPTGFAVLGGASDPDQWVILRWVH